MAADPTALALDDAHAAPSEADAPAHLKHYYVSSEQQFDAAKLGMWLFLVTEILLFGGMFVAYGIYRAMYPELFIEASTQLDTMMGAVNTVILLASSLTIAWSIRAIQMDRRRFAFWLLVATAVLASSFMVVKYFEYTHKFDLGILPGSYFVYPEGTELSLSGLTGESAVPNLQVGARMPCEAGQGGTLPEGVSAFTSKYFPVMTSEGCVSFVDPARNAELGQHGITNQRAGLFFSIYYVMTGIHGIHILIGIVAIVVLAVKTARGRFSSAWYTSIENVGLYWHVVDIIWIFLFPLMYLIA